jgi:antitoxin component of MazEF toxin-antitoxin module
LAVLTRFSPIIYIWTSIYARPTTIISRENPMGYPTTIQLIARNKGNQWYVNFPSALAKALEFKKGEVVEWTIQTKQLLRLRRTGATNRTEQRRRTDSER